MSIEESKKGEVNIWRSYDFPTMACSAFGLDGPRDLPACFFIYFVRVIRGLYSTYMYLYLHIYILFVHLGSRFCCWLIFRHQGLLLTN